ncbi:MAG: hypothetical protein NTV62_02370 [Candidatus Gribaldobacteria bacterium]|nr:hypothetical protein [Candidatus Gribaldobacteria bacterium]
MDSQNDQTTEPMPTLASPDTTQHDKPKQQRSPRLNLIPLGGLGEVGRNMMLLEYRNQILIIDAGFRMPEEDMPGIDYIIPNISYLRGKEKSILALCW